MTPDHPFFILGCVRSGTTLLRNILRTHPALFAPEETNFFRWADPYGHKMFRRYYFDIPSDVEDREPIYRLHRRMDGIEDDEFAHLLDLCRNRAELQTRYAELFLAKRGLEDRQWFDKSPQNIYGILLLRAAFPAARFVHLVRNPLDVAASMKIGRIIRSGSIIAACNYWLEAVQIFSQFKDAWPQQSYQVKTERLIKAPTVVLAELGEFLGFDADRIGFDLTGVRERPGNQRAVLDPAEVETVLELCGPTMKTFGYSLTRTVRRGRGRPSRRSAKSTEGDTASSPAEARLIAMVLRPGARVVATGVGGGFAHALAREIGEAGRILISEPDLFAYWSLVRDALPGSEGGIDVRPQPLPFIRPAVAPAPGAEVLDDIGPGPVDLLWFGAEDIDLDSLTGWLGSRKSPPPILAGACRRAGSAWTIVAGLRPLGYRAWLIHVPVDAEARPQLPVIVLIPEARLAAVLDGMARLDALSVETPDDLVRPLRGTASPPNTRHLAPNVQRMIRDFAIDSPELAREALVLLASCLGGAGVPVVMASDPAGTSGTAGRSAGGASSLAADLRILVEHHGLFDGAFYLEQHADEIDAGIDPFVHFLDKGWRERFDPSPDFEVGFYLDANPDVAASGMNPLLHYIFHGQAEGRRPTADTPTRRPIPVSSVEL